MEDNVNKNLKRKEKYRIRKIIYILLIALIVLNLVFMSHRSEEIIPNNNQIEVSKENDKINEKVEQNIINENKENNKAKMRYITKSTRTFFKKFEMFSLFGFFGVLYFVMWNNSNKEEEQNDDGNKEKENNNQNKYKYQLLKDEDDDYYENI